MSDYQGSDDTTEGWLPEIEELNRRRAMALNLGGADRVARHHEHGRLTARERIKLLVDPLSFREIGKLTGRSEYDSDGHLKTITPSNIIIGKAKIGGRPVVLAAEDFTVRGGSSEATSPDKWQFAERFALEYRMPLIRLVDAAGGSVRLLEQTQSTKIPGYPHWPATELLAHVPVIGMALGPCAGLGAVRVVASHFSVMVAGISQVFAAGPAVVEPGVGRSVTKEELGGSNVHARGSGVVDNEVISEEAAFAEARRFLSYLPSSVFEIAQVTETDDDPNRITQKLLAIVPRDRRKVYKTRDILNMVFDSQSLFEIGKLQGRSTITALGRLNGYVVGILANDPYFYGGSMTAGAAEKITRFVDMCDTFHLPIVNFVDQPGVYVGPEAESHGTIRKAIRARTAIAQSSVPWSVVFVRRAFGVAGAAYAPLNRATIRYAWPSAYWGSIPVEGGVEAAYKRDIESASDPVNRREALIAHYRRFESPFRTAERFGIEEIIDPRQTRPILCDWVSDAYRLLPELLGVTQHTMRP